MRKPWEISHQFERAMGFFVTSSSILVTNILFVNSSMPHKLRNHTQTSFIEDTSSKWDTSALKHMRGHQTRKGKIARLKGWVKNHTIGKRQGAKVQLSLQIYIKHTCKTKFVTLYLHIYIYFQFLCHIKRNSSMDTNLNEKYLGAHTHNQKIIKRETNQSYYFLLLSFNFVYLCVCL